MWLTQALSSIRLVAPAPAQPPRERARGGRSTALQSVHTEQAFCVQTPLAPTLTPGSVRLEEAAGGKAFHLLQIHLPTHP